MPWDDAIEVGRVLRARGLEGELQVALHGDDPSNLLRARRVLLDAAPGCIPYLVERAEPLPHGRGEAPRVRLKLLGLDRRELVGAPAAVAAVSERRKSARMRAVSSRRENGLVT